jgi:hypothetical protein
MSTSRRDFLIRTGATVLTGLWGSGSAQTAGAPLDITAALAAAGFNPNDPTAALLAVTADVHINLNTYWCDGLDGSLISEINSLVPRLTHVVFAGDVITSHSLTIGTPRYSRDYSIAREEMRTFRSQLARFREDLEVVMVPGNHDTDNEENLNGGVSQLWIEELGAPYQKRVLGGVPVFFLNSGHAGDLGPEQTEWFFSQVAEIDPNQEVLIVAHHPSFFRLVGEAGLKRKVATAFAGHRGTVWLIGGHGHGFYEAAYLERGTRFVQMEVTAGNAGVWNDGNATGYAVLGLQGGRVACRMFRSLKQPNFFPARPPAEQLGGQAIRWPFDRADFPVQVMEEGNYDRGDQIVGFIGGDVVSHFVYLKEIVWKADLSRFGGRIRAFLIAATISGQVLPSMTCSFSTVGASGPWVDVPLPSDDGGAGYRIPIPAAMWGAAQLYVRLRTSLDRFTADITVGGWGLGADASTLTGYQRWVSMKYGTVLATPLTGPHAPTLDSNLPNIVNFGFNLPGARVGLRAPSSGSAVLPTNPSITGLPRCSRLPGENITRLVFPRMRASANPGISYAAECSADLVNWVRVGANEMLEQVLRTDGEWEEVELRISDSKEYRRYYRISLSLTQPLIA